jgi:hypothetical protein
MAFAYNKQIDHTDGSLKTNSKASYLILYLGQKKIKFGKTLPHQLLTG